jgi:riboflavin transporter FmnP
MKTTTKSTTIPTEKPTMSTSFLAKVSILTALSVILLYIEFPLLPAVPHLKMEFSNMPALLATFMFGPITGTVVSAMKVVITLMLRGTSTGFVGDISNLISGALYVIAAGSIYHFKKTKGGAVLALVGAGIVFCGVMWLCNQFMLLPWFGITDKAVAITMLWWTLLFNAIKVVLTGAITFFLYKGTRRLFNRF